MHLMRRFPVSTLNLVGVGDDHVLWCIWFNQDQRRYEFFTYDPVWDHWCMQKTFKLNPVHPGFMTPHDFEFAHAFSTLDSVILVLQANRETAPSVSLALYHTKSNKIWTFGSNCGELQEKVSPILFAYESPGAHSVRYFVSARSELGSHFYELTRFDKKLKTFEIIPLSFLPFEPTSGMDVLCTSSAFQIQRIESFSTIFRYDLALDADAEWEEIDVDCSAVNFQGADPEHLSLQVQAGDAILRVHVPGLRVPDAHWVLSADTVPVVASTDRVYMKMSYGHVLNNVSAAFQQQDTMLHAVDVEVPTLKFLAMAKFAQSNKRWLSYASNADLLDVGLSHSLINDLFDRRRYKRVCDQACQANIGEETLKRLKRKADSATQTALTEKKTRFKDNWSNAD